MIGQHGKFWSARSAARVGRGEGAQSESVRTLKLGRGIILSGGRVQGPGRSIALEKIRIRSRFVEGAYHIDWLAGFLKDWQAAS